MELSVLIASIVWKVFLVIAGINALIIVHEFGHFIVARMCGVRCDKFYIWFDFWGLKFFKFKWGDTEYGLGVFPLGGYVKMLGQEDNPGQIAKEMERARAAAASTDLPTDVPNIEKLEMALHAKDSYLAKSVPQRMAIIVAGVVMNFFFAFVCAAAAISFGIIDKPAFVGGVTPGSPAWAAGLQTGDRIVEIGGTQMRHFNDIMQTIGTISEGSVRVLLERDNAPLEKDIVPQLRTGDLTPTIGVTNMPTLDLLEKSPLQKRFKEANIYSSEVQEKLKSGGTIDSVNGVSIASYRDFLRETFRALGKPVKIGFGGKEVELAAMPMNELPGFGFGIGPITAVQRDSDAFAKGLEAGDRIVKINGESFDPLRLPYDLRMRSNEGQKSVAVTIQKKDETTQTLELELIPDAQPTFFTGMSWKDAIACEPLGIAYKLGICEIDAITIFLNPVPKDFFPETRFSRKTKDGFQFHRIGDAIDLPFILLEIFQYLPPETKIRLHYGDRTEDVALSAAENWYNPERGLLFMPKTQTLKAESFNEAIVFGFNKMVDSSLGVYRFLANLGTRVSVRVIGGPVTIVKAAYHFTESGIGTYLLFLCLIGANLAVVNLLPIPVLDGGHLLFLAYEGITGRIPNETIQVVLSYMGLFLILFLMFWAFALDLGFVQRF